MVRPPRSVAAKIREAAKRDNEAAGPWCAAVLAWAVERGISISREPVVKMPVRYTDAEILTEQALKAAEESVPYQVTPKKKTT